MKSKAAVLLLVVPMQAIAVEATQTEIDYCKALSRVVASDAREKPFRQRSFAAERDGEKMRAWTKSVEDYIYQTAESTRLTRDELTAAGFAYCIARRPS